jgi:hypothetical protein
MAASQFALDTMNDSHKTDLDLGALRRMLEAEARPLETEVSEDCAEVRQASEELPQALTRRVEEARQALAQASPHIFVEEALLHQLVVGEFELFTLLEEVQQRLGLKLLGLTSDPKAAHAIARVLRDVVATNSMVARRVQDALAVGVSIRAQLTMLRAHRGGSDES